MIKVEMLTDFSGHEKCFIISREGSEKEDGYEKPDNLITIKKIKEVLAAIDVLFEKPEKTIKIYGGCIDVKPCSKEKADEIDPPIMNGLKVTYIGTKTLNLETKNYNGEKRIYKTAEINGSYNYEGKTFYDNTIDEVRITIKK